jgi:AcrR family transcriptional regulator
MAWRIHDQVVRVIMDNQIPGKITGSVWLAGQNDPLQLDLVGNPWRDMAGCILTIKNPKAVPDPLGGLANEQRGICGDLTASRRVKIPTVPLAEWLKSHRGEPAPYVWGNGVYLEWFSERNGRVVIELSGVEVHLSEPAWSMTLEQERAQTRRNAEALNHFMHQLATPFPDHTSHSSSTRNIGNQAGSKPESTPVTQANADADRELAQRIRIETLKEKVRDRVGGKMLSGGDENAPLDVLERFWENVLEFEEGLYPLRPIRELLAEDGMHPLSPDLIPAYEIEAHLERLIEALAQRGILLCRTDHLSDHELYTVLVEHVLAEETESYPIHSGWFTHIDLAHYGGSHAFLRYYADESERQEWHHDFPHDPMPPHEEPPYDRDQWLP